MNNINLKSIKRIYNFTKMEFLQKINELFITFGIIYGIIFLNLLVNLIFNKFNKNYFINVIPFYYISLFFGVIIVSNIFTQIYEKKLTIFYFTLPGTLFEKVFSKFLFSIILFFILNFLVLILVYYFIILLILIGLPINLKIYDFSYFLNLFINSFWVYFYVSSIFFFFSTLWEKNSFISTLISIVLFFIFIAISITLILNILIKSNIIDIYKFSFSGKFWINIYNNKFLLIISKILYYFIPFAFYILTYFSFKKKQVSRR
jgi:hypothetical protein